MLNQNTAILSSPGTTPPWTTQPHHGPDSQYWSPCPDAPTMSQDTNSDSQELLTYKELVALQMQEPKPLSVNYCRAAMSPFNVEPTPRPMTIARKMASSSRKEVLPSTPPTRPKNSLPSGKPLGHQLSPEPLMGSLSPFESSTTEPGSPFDEITKSSLHVSSLLAECGSMDRQGQVSPILFHLNSQMPSSKMLPSGGVVTPAKRTFGSTMLTPRKQDGSPDSSRFGEIGTPSKPRPKEDRLLSDQEESWSPLTTRSMPWDFESQMLRPSEGDSQNS